MQLEISQNAAKFINIDDLMLNNYKAYFRKSGSSKPQIVAMLIIYILLAMVIEGKT
jgi:hypothetical protein